MLELWEKEKVYEKALERRKGKEKFHPSRRAPLCQRPPPPRPCAEQNLERHYCPLQDDGRFLRTLCARLGLPWSSDRAGTHEGQKIDKAQIDRKEIPADAAAYATKYVEIQKQEFKRMGVLGDWDHPYLTMDEVIKRRYVRF